MMWNATSRFVRLSLSQQRNCLTATALLRRGGGGGIVTVEQQQQCRWISSVQSSFSSSPWLKQHQEQQEQFEFSKQNTRNMSSGEGYSPNSSSVRAYPTYTVFGETCLLSVKFSTPTFKILPKSNVLVVDGSNRRGRLLLEWTPRTPDGRTDRDGQIRFSLSPEEVGLLLDQLPDNEIELSRRLFSATGSSSIEEGGGPPSFVPNEQEPEKVFRVMSGDTPRSLKFRIDFEKDGIGGQPQHGGGGTAGVQLPQAGFDNQYVNHTTAPPIQGPLDVEVQAGEFQVIQSILKTSLPYLIGWSTQIDIALQNQVEQALAANNNNHRSSGGGGGYNSGY